MRGADVERVLKAGERRSVRLERAADGARCVVKRFASTTLAGATLDRARATREHRMLSELAARGLAVPRPFALEALDGAWEVRMEWIEGGVTLARVLAGSAPWPRARERVLGELARLLAGLHAAGLDHPDLHAGNVLLDASGRPWAIDFHKARRVRALRARTLLRDLVRIAAGVREVLGPGTRARFYVAWRRALPSDLRASLDALGTPRELAERIEREARARRVAVVRTRRARWTRSGTACTRLRGAFEGFARIGADAALVARLDALARTRGESASVEEGVLLITAPTKRAARRAWWAAARLVEHGLPAARPLAVVFEPRPWLALELPSPCAPCERPRGRRALRALGRLCAQLADRELEPRPGACPMLHVDAHGAIVLAGVADLAHEARAGSGVDLVRTLRLAGLALADLARAERCAFALGLLSGVPRSRGEQARLRAALLHG